MNRIISAPLFAVAMFVGMLLFLEVGRLMGLRRARDPEGTKPGLGAVEGSIFALFGLLMAFTFSGAANRFDVRRMQIADEANMIGTAFLRLDLLPPETQPVLRDLFRRYLDSRLRVYRLVSDVNAALEELQNATRLQNEIWTSAVAACKHKDSSPVATTLLLPALNQMMDITTTRTMFARTHPPPVIHALLLVLALICSLLTGYASAEHRRRSWIHLVGFIAITVCTVFVILDMEYPRVGFIRLDPYDQVLVDLRDSMK